MEPDVDTNRGSEEEAPTIEEKQCRICLDGVEAEQEMGRLIRPCLCKGSISYVHVKCLQRWRNSSNSSAFFSCPQCHYKYRFSRTRVVGIATNPRGISAVLFFIITFLSSFLTTYLLSFFQEPTTTFYISTGSFFYVSPLEVVHDLVKAAFRILDGDQILESGVFPPRSPRTRGGGLDTRPIENPGVLRRFISRFVIGLPLVGSISLLHMLLTLPFIGPVHWLARYRGNRRRNNNDTRDITALILVLLLALGVARSVFPIFQEFLGLLTILLNTELSIVYTN
ncbi:hypothetical protein PQX77_003814 [Marasmius sp. AFHP31]|nr:hypothetical protein PQX77_003814 [Marasmius sp. AFHP31]